MKKTPTTKQPNAQQTLFGILFALSLAALRVNTPEAVDALREVPTAAASHA